MIISLFTFIYVTHQLFRWFKTVKPLNKCCFMIKSVSFQQWMIHSQCNLFLLWNNQIRQCICSSITLKLVKLKGNLNSNFRNIQSIRSEYFMVIYWYFTGITRQLMYLNNIFIKYSSTQLKISMNPYLFRIYRILH